MKITVLGLWHLGSVTAACCAEHFRVTGLEFDEKILEGLRGGEAPVQEPGLDALLAKGIAEGRLTFDDDAQSACAGADVLWVCVDTPVDADDEADSGHVLERARLGAGLLPAGAVVILSSQVPIGTSRMLAREFPGLDIVCAPENLRLGSALESFRKPERIILGVRGDAVRERLEPLFTKWSRNIVWMRPESAEMTKHGLNCFLAMSIAFMNEMAGLCEMTGADASEVERGLKSDGRIGPGAYLRAGGAFGGGTLAREVVALTRLGERLKRPLALIPAIKRSNDEHKSWPLRNLRLELGPLRGRIVAVLGLTYKPNTSTLRRSLAIELCEQLVREGADLRAFDPSLTSPPAEIESGCYRQDIESAVDGADAVVLGTEWPQFRSAPWPDLAARMRHPLILDAGGFIGAVPGASYLRVGAPIDSELHEKTAR